MISMRINDNGAQIKAEANKHPDNDYQPCVYREGSYVSGLGYEPRIRGKAVVNGLLLFPEHAQAVDYARHIDIKRGIENV